MGCILASWPGADEGQLGEGVDADLHEVVRLLLAHRTRLGAAYSGRLCRYEEGRVGSIDLCCFFSGGGGGGSICHRRVNRDGEEKRREERGNQNMEVGPQLV